MLINLYIFEFRIMEMFYFLFDSKVRINILLLNVVCWLIVSEEEEFKWMSDFKVKVLQDKIL